MVLNKVVYIFILVSFVSAFLFGVNIGTARASVFSLVFDPTIFSTIVKDYVVNELIRATANALQNKLVNMVQSKFTTLDGKTPAFVTNWRNQILDSRARGNDTFRSVLADTSLCPYFSSTLLQAFGAQSYRGAINGSRVSGTTYQNKTYVPGQTSFQYASRCTLPTNFNATAFSNDFTKGGGWDAWDALLEPQNTFWGAYSLALQEQYSQQDISQQAALSEATAGGGFLSRKLGLNSAITNGPSGCTDKAGTVQAGGYCASGLDCAGDLLCVSNKCTSPPTTGNSGKPAGSVCASDNDCSSGLVCLISAQTNQQYGPGKGVCQATPANTVVGGRCVFEGKIVTPSQILGTTLANTFDSKLKVLGGATALADVAVSLFQSVLNNLTNRLTNLVDQGFSDQPANKIPPLIENPQQTNTPWDNSQQQCINSCTQNLGYNCNEKAKVQDCSANGGTGGSGAGVDANGNPISGDGGTGGDVNCQTTIDPVIYDACIADGQAACQQTCNTNPTTP